MPVWQVSQAERALLSGAGLASHAAHAQVVHQDLLKNRRKVVEARRQSHASFQAKLGAAVEALDDVVQAIRASAQPPKRTRRT